MEPLDLPAHYARVRASLIDLAASITDAQANTIVPASPEWTIRDVFAHLAGSNADVLAGRLEGVTTDPWTQRQVEERSDLSLFEIASEWSSHAPAIDALLEQLGDAMDVRLYIDQWTHAQDIAAALGHPLERDPQFVTWLGQISASTMVARAAKRAPGPISIAHGGVTTGDIGDADVWAELTTDDFTLGRVLVGRRSAAQLNKLDWRTEGAEPSDWFSSMVVFSISDDDIADLE